MPEIFSTSASCGLANGGKLSLAVTAQCEVRLAGWVLLGRLQHTLPASHDVAAS